MTLPMRYLVPRRGGRPTRGWRATRPRPAPIQTTSPPAHSSSSIVRRVAGHAERQDVGLPRLDRERDALELCDHVAEPVDPATLVAADPLPGRQEAAPGPRPRPARPPAGWRRASAAARGAARRARPTRVPAPPGRNSPSRTAPSAARPRSSARRRPPSERAELVGRERPVRAGVARTSRRSASVDGLQERRGKRRPAARRRARRGRARRPRRRSAARRLRSAPRRPAAAATSSSRSAAPRAAELGRATDRPAGAAGRACGRASSVRPSPWSSRWTWSIASPSSSSRRSSCAQELGEQRPVELERLGAPLGRRRVALVHVGRDVVEEERRGERRRHRRLDLDQAHLPARDRLAAGPSAPAPRRRPRAPRGRSRAGPGTSRTCCATCCRSCAFSRCCQSGVRCPGRRRGMRSARAAFSRKRAAKSGLSRDPVDAGGRRGRRAGSRSGRPAAACRSRAGGWRCRRRPTSTPPRSRARSPMRASTASAHGAWTRPPNGESTHTRQSPISSRNRSTTIVRSDGMTPVAASWSSR